MVQRTEVLTPTEARQASPRRLNFRVLVVSMTLALVVAAILYFAVYNPRSPIGLHKQPPEQTTVAPDSAVAPEAPPAPAPSPPANP